MQTQLIPPENPFSVDRWNPYINDRCETHLEYTLWFVSASGRNRWLNGKIDWNKFESPDDLLNYILQYQTAFVNQQWFRLEVCVPNRNHYGWLESGFIKDTGILLVTRQILH